MKQFLCGMMMLVLGFQTSMAQGDATQKPASTFNRSGRWSIGVRGGGNIWFNDFDTRKLSGSGEAFVRYAFSRKFSLGVMGAYDALLAEEKNIEKGGPFLTPIHFPYVEAKGISGDLTAWFHFLSGKASPYVYAGIGAFNYKRKILGAIAPVPASQTKTTIHIPVGIGLDIMLNKNVGLNLDLGARFTDDSADAWKGNATNKTTIGVFDWHATGKAGLTFYLGGSDGDDDDGDGLTNGEEKALGTNPNVADTDGDGLNDGEEMNVYKTNPLKPDSDGDGLNDGAEVNTHKTDPNNPDTDGDGLNDGDEVGKYTTDPMKTDTDGDGLTDGDEALNKMTNPLKPDTDGDGLRDGDEVSRKTDPNKADTDGGSVNDGQEVTNGTNPLVASDDVKKTPKPEVGKPMVLEGIVFKTGSARIDPQSEATLMLAYNTLKDYPEISVEIRGHTDNVGSKVRNQKLSMDRAKEVRWWLVKKGIVGSRITAKGFGPDSPIGDNKTADGRQKNRRIEFARTK